MLTHTAFHQALPNELERLLLRPEISTHIARTFSANVTPLVERHVKDTISQVLVPNFQQTAIRMQNELASEFSSEIISIKKEVLAWQSEAIRNTEVSPCSTPDGSTL
jgi:hypothetical protein